MSGTMTESSTLRTIRIPAFLAAAVLLVAVGIAMVVGIRRLDDDVARVEHTYQVLQVLEEHQNALRTAESASRGFRLSGSAGLLSEYRLARPVVARTVETLVSLTAGDPDQQARARALSSLDASRLAEIDRLVEVHLEQDADTARAQMDVGLSLQQMAAIEDKAGELRDVEHARLAERRQAAGASVERLTVLVAAGIALPLLLLGVLVSHVLGENRRVRRLERAAQASLQNTELLLVQRNRLSEQHRTLGRYAGLLQSSQSLEEAMRMTANVLAELLPDAGGRCYVLRSSQNRAESAAHFGTEAWPSSDLLTADQCWALRTGQPHRTGGPRHSMPCTHYREDVAPAADAWSHCVPLTAQGTSLGLLHVNGRGVEPDGDHALIEAVGEQLSLAMVNLHLRETLRQQSLRDPLTGLYNRRYLEESLQREMQRCQRRALPLSLLMLDIDHFKRFNDSHGHGAGDALLARIGQVLSEMTRGEDIACRYGGEEFTLVLPEVGAVDAARRAEEIRRVIASTTVLYLRKALGPATCSIGVATFPDDESTQARLMEAADSALYRAKALGRDRVEVAAPST